MTPIMQTFSSEFDPEFPIGRVIAVSAAQIIVLMHAAHPEMGRPPIELASLVKVQTRASTVFGMISGLRVPLPSVAMPEEDMKIIEIELIGEAAHDSNGGSDGF